MTKLIRISIAAFSNLAGTPQAELAIGLALKAVIPYLIAPIAIAVILSQFLSSHYVFWTVLCGGLAWIILLQMARSAIKSRRPLAWHQGHYRAAFLVLCLGYSHRTRKPESIEEGEEDPPVRPEK